MTACARRRSRRWTSRRALPRLRARVRRRGHRRAARHPARRTSATSPGSPARPAMLLVTPTDAACFVTDGRYRDQSARAARRGRVSTPTIEIGATAGRAARRAGRGARAGDRPARARGARRHAGRSSATFARRGSPAHELVPTDGARRRRCASVKEPGEVDAHPCRVRDRRRRARPSCCPTLARRPTEREFALELEFAMRERGASGNSFDPIVAVGPERRQAARPADGPAHRAATSSSSSTSAASSTATAPT